MPPDVGIDHFGHESVHCAPASRNDMQQVGALAFLIKASFYRGDLPVVRQKCIWS
jgi:hypothetical protein